MFEGRERRAGLEARPAVSVAATTAFGSAGDGGRAKKRSSGPKVGGKRRQAFQESGDSRCGLSEYIAIGGAKYGVLRIWAAGWATGAAEVGREPVPSTRTSARRSRTLVQMHTPTHHARTPGVAEGGSGALLANGIEAFQQTAGLVDSMAEWQRERMVMERDGGGRRASSAAN